MAVSDPEAIVQAAAGLASRRDYEAAKAMLDRLEPAQETRQAKHLRAKIAAQQRQFDLAIDLWRKILQEDPQDVESQKALRLAERMKRSRMMRLLCDGRMHLAAVLVIAASLVIGTLVWAIPAARGWRSSLMRQEAMQERLDSVAQAAPSPSDAQEDRYRLLVAEISRLQASAEASDRRAQADAQTLSQRVDALADLATRLEARVQSDNEQLTQLVQTLARSHAESDAQARTELDRLAQIVPSLANDQENRHQLLVAEISRLQVSAETSDRRAQADAQTLSQRVDALADLTTRLDARVQSDNEQVTQLVRTLARSGAESDAQAQKELEQLAQNVAQLAGDLSERENADRQRTETFALAVNELTREHRDCLAAMRTDFSQAIALSNQIEDLIAVFQKLEKKFWGPNAKDRRIILQSLDRLQQDADALTTRMERP